jgi:hypothetical protein
MKKSYTKDEIYLLKFYEMACGFGDETSEVDRYAVGRAVGYNDKAVDSLTRNLLQANFLKKSDGSALYLTLNGLRLIHALKNL